MFPASTYRSPTIPSTHDDPKLDLIPHPTPTRFCSQHSSRTTTTNQHNVPPFDIPYVSTIPIYTTESSSNSGILHELDNMMWEENDLLFRDQEEILAQEEEEDLHGEHEELFFYTSSTTRHDEMALHAYENKLSIIFHEIIFFDEENMYEFNTDPLITNLTCSIFKHLHDAHRKYEHAERDHLSKPTTHPPASESKSLSTSDENVYTHHNHPPPNITPRIPILLPICHCIHTDSDSDSDSYPYSDPILDKHHHTQHDPSPPSVTPRIPTPIITPRINMLRHHNPISHKTIPNPPDNNCSIGDNAPDGDIEDEDSVDVSSHEQDDGYHENDACINTPSIDKEYVHGYNAGYDDCVHGIDHTFEAGNDDEQDDGLEDGYDDTEQSDYEEQLYDCNEFPESDY